MDCFISEEGLLVYLICLFIWLVFLVVNIYDFPPVMYFYHPQENFYSCYYFVGSKYLNSREMYLQIVNALLRKPLLGLKMGCEMSNRVNSHTSFFPGYVFLITEHPVGGKLAPLSKTKVLWRSDGTSLRWLFTSIKSRADTDRTCFIYVGCTD